MAVPSWVAYIPVPGVALLAAYGAPTDRLARFHAWQGGIHVAAWWVGLIALGYFMRWADASAADPTPMAILFGFVYFLYLVAGLTGCVMGAVAAAKGRYARVRPAWDLLAGRR